MKIHYQSRISTGGAVFLAILVAALYMAAQTSRPRPGASPSVVSSFLRWGGGAFTTGNCLKLDATGAAADAGGPCSLPAGDILFFAGPRTAGHCVEFDAQGRAVSAGAPCGTGSGGGGEGVNWVFVDIETPTGAMNSVNSTFVLQNTPNPASSLKVFWNGLRLRRDVDYTLISGNTIVIISGTPPSALDQFFVEYRYIP